MRSDASEVGSLGSPKRSPAGARRRATRKSSPRRLALEAMELEPRTLLSNLPAPTVLGTPTNISQVGGNQSSPSIAVDPSNPLKVVSAWTRIDTNLQNTQVVAEMAYSVDGGQTWSGPTPVGTIHADPNKANAVFAQVTDASVAFDRNDNFYILDSQHAADYSDGELLLNKYSFATTIPRVVSPDVPVYRWVQDPAYLPMLAVDDNAPTFTDTDVNGTTQDQSDPYSGDVYVAWATNDVAPKNVNNFNPDRIVINVSSDGGQNFSGYQVVSNFSGISDPLLASFGSQRNTAPQLAISQGAAPRQPGTDGPTDPGSAGIKPGQVTVVWDDFGTEAKANPAQDVIWANQSPAGFSAVFTANGGQIGDATAGTPRTTKFTDTVSITDPSFTTLSDLAVTLNINHPADAELRVVLTPPQGSGLQPITLVSNQVDAAGNPTGAGVTGANFGTVTNGPSYGTTFSDNAVRSITDGNSAAPFTGVFRPEGGSLDSLYGGATAAQLSGNWTLSITDFRNGNVGTLGKWSLAFTSGLTPSGSSNQVTTTTVRGSLTEAVGLGTGITPLGIGPGLSLAQDNTLGAYSPYQGRLYLAYVDRSTAQNNPADNTDIFLIASDDGGLTWRPPAGFQSASGFYFGSGQLVNDDNATTDGFSESDPGLNGRPQLEPQVAVDQATGSLVMSWYDARNDASRVRVATYVTASNDGGQSFTAQEYLNQSQTAVDAITGQTVSLGPIPDSASPDPNVDHTFGFGLHQGLAVYGGTIHAAWSSDLNGGFGDGKLPLAIRTASATIAGGPRIIASTMGPVGLPGDTVNPDQTADGTPIAEAFQVTFDRPVDPSTFTADQVQVFYHDPTTTNVSGEQVPVTSVTPLNRGPFGATRFQVNFAPRSGVGTYSYVVGPDIRDRIRTTAQVINPSGSPQSFPTTTPVTSTGFNGSITSSVAVSGFAANVVVDKVTVSNLSITEPYDFGLNISLVAPDGTSVTLYDGFQDYNGGNYQDFTNTTFDDSAARPVSRGQAPYTGSFQPDVPLSSLAGHTLNGTWKLVLEDFFGDTITLKNWTLNLTPGVVGSNQSSGNAMDQNANGRPGEPAASGFGPGDDYAAPSPTTTGSGFIYKPGQFFPGPYAPSTLPLIVPGPHVVSTSIPGTVPGSAAVVNNGSVSAIDVTFDRDMQPGSFTPAQVLRIAGPAGAITAPQSFPSGDVGRTIPDDPTQTFVSTLTVPNNGGSFPIAALTVNLNIASTRDGDLAVALIAPDGTRVPLVTNAGGVGANFTGTTFSDTASTSIDRGAAPFTGTYRPEGSLASLIGKQLQGTWKLQIVDGVKDGSVSTLTGWSLSATPTLTVTPNPLGTDPDPAHPRTYRIGFPQQTDSGTYTVQLASTITSKNGDQLDTNLNAGVDVLRGTPSTNAIGPVVYPSTNVPQALPAGATATSTLTVPDNFTIQGLQVALDISEANDPDLSAVLVGPDGTSVTLFSGVGAAGSHANFTRTIFDDAAGTSIQNGGPPFTGRYQPQQPLSTFVGKVSAGTWKLVVSSNNPQGVAGVLNNWSLTFTQSTVSYPSTSTSLPLPVGGTVSSTLTVPDNFIAENPTVTLDIGEPYDPGLTAQLVAPDGTTITLFQNLPAAGSNFTQTTFDDSATSLITGGSPPYSGRFKPQQALSNLAGMNAGGTWKLVLTTDKASADSKAQAGILNGWSLSFQKVAPITGLGEPVADQFSTSFRIFQMDPSSTASSTAWTPVGPTSARLSGSAAAAGATNGYAGSATSVAVDPSDPSGNTVYMAAASGGIWKTTDFLTTDAAGPTWIPLTDFGPTFGMNIGSIAVFGRNNDPSQSIIFAGTGNGNALFSTDANTSQGVGILRSTDGGATWTLLDSTNNTLPFSVPASAPAGTPVRDHIFAANGGTSTFKIAVDPRSTANGNVIVYAALGSGTDSATNLSNGNGGLWRSLDSGNTWQKMSSAAQGDATDVVLDLNSATVDQVSNPTGNVNVIYAGFENAGVYISPNRGQTLNAITGNNFDALIRDPSFAPPVAIPVGNGQVSLAGARVTLAKPALVPAAQAGADVKNLQYEGWLYAAVTGANGHLLGLFVTKDFGQTWTKVRIPTVPSPLKSLAEPTNDPTKPDYDPVGSTTAPTAPYDVALTVDPSDPNVIYLGGTSDGQQSGLIRMDLTGIYDSHALVGYDNNRPDNGALQINTNGRVAVKKIQDGLPQLENNFFVGNNPTQYVNLIQDPQNQFQSNSTLYVYNVASNAANAAGQIGFTNDGSGISWIPFDQILQANATDTISSTNLHQALALTDPLTGKTRLVFADDQGIFTGVDNGDGTLASGIGTLAAPTYSRNGDLQIAQFFYGASQPSSAAAQVAQALYYGNGLNLGQTNSNPNIVGDPSKPGYGDPTGGTLPISGFGTGGDLYGTGIATDQQGRGIVYQYAWPGFGGSYTNFFQVSSGGGAFVARTAGLVQQANDPQWPIAIPNYPAGIRPGNFAVNPLDGDQVIISSNAGRIFSTTNQGASWQVIGNPGDLDSSYAPALAFGAPDPNSPNGTSNLNDFLYAGTIKGDVFLTQTGGGGAGNQWANVSNGLDGSAVVQIATNPTRGSHEAYAVTEKGVYHIADSVALVNALAANATAASAGTPAPYTRAQLLALGWQNITGTGAGNLFNLTLAPFGNQAEAGPRVAYLTSIVADWRYAIPADPSKPADPTTNPTHPLLYVAGEGGVFRSLDGGQSWALFPGVAFDGARVDGGLLPNAHVTSLTTSLGNIDPTTGRAVAQPGDPNTLLASTLGRGEFAIRLAPVVFPASLQLDATRPAPGGSASGGTAPDGTPLVQTAQPVIDGLSEQTAFGDVARITLLDMTDPSNPRIIGGYDPNKPATDVAANHTDATGHFAVQVNLGSFPSNGPKVIGVEATDASGNKGNIATLRITLQATNLGLPQPPTAPTLALLPIDDTSGGQDVTSVTSPHLIGRSDPSNPGNTVTITLVQVSGPPVAVPAPVTTSPADGTFSFQLPPLADGTYTFQVRASNAYSPPSTTGQSLTFTVKTAGPQTAPTLLIDPRDDSGVKGDGITDVRQPRFIGQTDPGAIVDLYNVLTSSIVVPASALNGPNVQGITVDLSAVKVANLNALTVTLTGPDGTTTPVAVGQAVIVSAFNGKAAAGAYTLRIINPTASSGTFGGWSMTLTDSANANHPFSSPMPVGPGTLIQPKLTSAVADGSGRFSIQLPNVLVNGPTALEAFAHDVAGNQAPAPSAILNLSIVTVAGDYNLDGKADPAIVQRVNPGLLQWNLQGVAPAGGFGFGAGGLDVPLSGDFDGDGKTDTALYRPSTATWYINRSKLGPETITFGWPGVDIPAPADYTGSGLTDVAVYRPTSGQWFIIGPDNALVLQRDASGKPILDGNGVAQVPAFGGPGDQPVPGDYNGTGQAELAVYRPSTSTFFTIGPNGAVAAPVTLGKTGDIPVPGQYDNSASYHRDEYAVFDPSTATWIIDGPNGVIRTVQFGAPGDIPAPADYDGTGVTELAVYRPSSGLLLVQGASGTVQLGTKGGFPVNAPYMFRQVTSIAGDFAGNGTADLALYQRSAGGSGQWLIQNVSPPDGIGFGSGALDVPLVGDFTGSGYSQLALYRPSTAEWIIPSLGADFSFGQPGVDIPVPGKYLGGQTSYVGVFRPTTGQWFVNGQTVTYGQAGDVPVPGNYAGTGITELAVYRPSTAQWFILGQDGTTQTIGIGQVGDVPVPGNYAGTGRDQPAVYRPSTGQFLVENPDDSGLTTITLGSPNSIPAPGDYDGNGRDELAVYNPSTAVWSILEANGTVRTVQYGYAGSADIPVLAPYVYREAPATQQALGVHAASAGPIIAALNTAPVASAGSGAGNSPTPTVTTTASAAPAAGQGRHRVVPQAAHRNGHPHVHDAALEQLHGATVRHARNRLLRGL